jgi:hypothetical protein
MRPNCECCDQDLSPSAEDVWICSFECTWCTKDHYRRRLRVLVTGGAACAMPVACGMPMVVG